MATKETQKRIIETAIELFNEHGTAAISANRIADACELSRGNLYYHYNNKAAIIHAIYERIAAEIRNEWADDLARPTVRHMLDMFDRQLELIWRYRFFYRELVALLAADERLHERFRKDRRERTKVIIEYCRALIENGVLLGPRDERALENLVKLSWILSDNFINYISVDEEAAYPECVSDGKELLIELFKPYLSPSTLLALEQEKLVSRRGSSLQAGGS